MFELIVTPNDIEKEMTKLRNKHCAGLSAINLGEFSKRIASIIPREGGMRRGIVNRLGELWACVRLGLQLMPEGNKGYDAVDAQGKRYQVKSRHPEKGERVNLKGTTPHFTSFEFDEAILVLMDKNLQNYEIWLADSDSVQGNIRPQRKDMQILRFQQIGRRVYPPLS